MSFQYSPMPRAFDSCSPYERQSLFDCMGGDDPLGINDGDELYTSGHVQCPSGYEDQIQNNIFSPYMTAGDDFDDDLLTNIPNPSTSSKQPSHPFDCELPPPTAAYDSTDETPWVSRHVVANSVPAQGQVVQEEWDYSQPQGSSGVPVPVAHAQNHPVKPASIRQCQQQPPYFGLTRLTTTPSQAYSSDVGRSPKLLPHNLEVPASSSQTSSTAPSESDLPDPNIQLDQAGENTGAGAGIDMSLMEGFSDIAAQEFALCEPVYDPTVPSVEDGNEQLPPQNATAYTREYFSMPTNTTFPVPVSRGMFSEQWAFDFTEDAISPRITPPRPRNGTANFAKQYIAGYSALSDRYEPNVPNSFPTTQHHYHPNAPPGGQMQTDHPSTRPVKQSCRRAADSSPQQAQSRTLIANASVDKRRRRRSTASNSRPNHNPLSPIFEGRVAIANLKECADPDTTGSQPLSRTTSEKARARRSGPLPENARTAAADKRANENTCFNCRSQKIKVLEDGAACSVQQQLLDGTKFIQIPVSGTFHLGPLLKFLVDYQANYNIQAMNGSQPLFVFDLKRCYAVMSQITKSPFDLQELFGKTPPTRAPLDWLTCVREYDTSSTEIERLITWCPTRAVTTYRLVHREISGMAPRALNIYDSTDSIVIERATALRQILLRDVEIVAYTALYKQCDELLTKSAKIDAPEIMVLLDCLGRLLCALRSQLSLNTGRSLSEIDHAKRLTDLARILYRYYFLARERRDKLTHSNSVLNTFPVDETQHGFEQWLRRGSGHASQPDWIDPFPTTLLTPSDLSFTRAYPGYPQ
ncbi:MAG: hypothetical protein Q9217_001747 [Psora testacea]